MKIHHFLDLLYLRPNLSKLNAKAVLTLSLILFGPLIVYAQKNKNESYIIHSKSAYVKSVDIKGAKNKGNMITIQLSSENAGSAYSERPEGTNAQWANIPPPQITNITVMQGFYSRLQKVNENNRSNSTHLTQVNYPIRLKVEISDQNFEVEILEPGSWTIKVILDNIYNPDLFSTPIN